MGMGVRRSGKEGGGLLVVGKVSEWVGQLRAWKVTRVVRAWMLVLGECIYQTPASTSYVAGLSLPSLQQQWEGGFGGRGAFVGRVDKLKKGKCCQVFTCPAKPLSPYNTPLHYSSRKLL